MANVIGVMADGFLTLTWLSNGTGLPAHSSGICVGSAITCVMIDCVDNNADNGA